MSMFRAALIVASGSAIIASSDKPNWLLGLGTLGLAVAALLGWWNSRLARKDTEQTKKNTESIKKQFDNNGGTTARDVLDRLEQGHRELHKGLGEVRHEVGQLSRRLTATEVETAQLADVVTAPPKPKRKAS